MADFYGLKILLLLAGLIELAICQKAQSSGNFNTTTPKCSYKVIATKYGLRISISNLPPTTVTISYKEQNDGKIQNMTFNHSQNSTIHNVTSLKPCTIYTVTIREHDCDIQGSNNLTTWKIEQDDITTNTKIMRGEICYSSLWDISEAIQDPKFTKDTSRNLCFKFEPNDYCSNVNTTFEQKTCDNPNSTFTIITSIPVELFMDEKKVDLTHPQVLPAILKWTNKPVHCLSKLTFNYTCRGDNKNEFFSAMIKDNDTVLPEMEPFTAYNCTSRIYGSNKSFEKTANLKIDCDLNVLDLQNISWSNESISLNWSPEVKKCPNTVLSNIAYECCCTNKMGWNKCNNIVKKQCNIHNLEAFTDYNCFVKPVKYKDKPINNNGKQITVKTAIGGRYIIQTSYSDVDR
ncbi:uncharacterized protein LOC117594831 [Esox lucius]|uniref:uncharacterized protein LOC117594831 n=1 Tax=Esox lucius TaxID=8010 RepID=UPI0014769AFF|nr:uncharacterized protein LOC117594831 [Esox lucius]